MPPITPTVKLIIAGLGVAAVSVTAAALLLRRRKTQKRKKILSAGIARHAERYDGLYEGLCQILSRQEAMERDALKEWCERTSRIEGEPEYTAAFRETFNGALTAPEEEYREKLSLLLECIAGAGITRTEAETIPYAAAKGAYIYLGEGTPAGETVCSVVKPCWMFQGRPVEQGIIMKGEP